MNEKVRRARLELVRKNQREALEETRRAAAEQGMSRGQYLNRLEKEAVSEGTSKVALSHTRKS